MSRRDPPGRLPGKVDPNRRGALRESRPRNPGEKQSMSPEAIIHKIDDILIEEFELEPEAVVPDARLREDLDLDSLDGVDLVVALEKAFEFRIDGKVVVEMKTVGDIHEYVRRHFGTSDQIDASRAAAATA
jgi:acyl carrier protein